MCCVAVEPACDDAIVAAAVAMSTLLSASPLADGGARCDADDAAAAFLPIPLAA